MVWNYPKWFCLNSLEHKGAVTYFQLQWNCLSKLIPFWWNRKNYDKKLNVKILNLKSRIWSQGSMTADIPLLVERVYGVRTEKISLIWGYYDHKNSFYVFFFPPLNIVLRIWFTSYLVHFVRWPLRFLYYTCVNNLTSDFSVHVIIWTVL